MKESKREKITDVEAKKCKKNCIVAKRAHESEKGERERRQRVGSKQEKNIAAVKAF
jgi:hypothetical protein